MQMPVRPDRQLPGAQTALNLAEALQEAKHEHGYVLPAAERSALHGVITVAAHIAGQDMAGRYVPQTLRDRLAAVRERLDGYAVQAGAVVCVAPEDATGLTVVRTYPLLPDQAALRLDLLRLVNDHGEPALHPARLFQPVADADSGSTSPNR